MHASGNTTETTLLRRALAHWESELRSVGGPDDLLRLDLNSPRLLDLGIAHPNGMAGFLAGRPTQLSTLFRSPDSLRAARGRARALALAARRLEDVYGLSGAFLATGVFRFDDPVLGRVQAPIVLRPLSLAPRGAGADVDFDLYPGESARLNPALLALLAEQGIAISGDELTGDDHGVVARQLIDRLTSARHQLDGTIADKNLIGTFTDAGPAMVAALRELDEEVSGHRTVRALLRRPSGGFRSMGAQTEQGSQAGGGAQRGVGQSGLTWQVSQVADRPLHGQSGMPDRAWLLDPAQLAVLQAVQAGGDVRVEAAPGAGVTTTAAAAVDALTAAGKQLLVVAPGVDELTDLVTALSSDPGAAARAVQVAERSHSQLHQVDPSWGRSPMQVISRLAELGASPAEPGAAVLSPVALRSLAGDRRAAVALLETAAEADVFTEMAVASPWAGAAIGDALAAKEALVTVQLLLDTELPRAEAELAEVAATVGLPVGLSLTEWQAHIEVLASVRGTLDLFQAQVYEDVTEAMVVACAPGSWRAAHGVSMPMLERRRWRRDAAALVRPGVHPADLHVALSRARLDKELWQRLGGVGEPRITPRLADAISAYERVAAAVAGLEPVLSASTIGGQLADLSVEELRERLRRLAAAGPDLRKLPERAGAIAELDALGLTGLVTQLRAEAARRPGELDVARALEVAWLRGVLAELGGLPASAPAVPAPRQLAELPEQVAARLTTTTAMGLGRLPGQARFDTVLLLDAHRLGLSESVLGIGRSEQVVLFGDPAGGSPTGLELDSAAERVRTSLFTASAGLLDTCVLDRVHRQPTALAALTYRLAAGPAVRPAWSVASPGGGELGFVHVPGGTVSADESGDSIPGQEVEGVVAQIAEHVRTRGGESLAVFTASRGMSVEVADALRRALRRSPELAEWLAAETAEPLAVTDLRHAGEVSRDHVILALGLAHDPFGRFSHRFGALDTDSGAALIGAGVGRARRRVTVVSSLWPGDIDPALIRTEGGRRALSLLAEASGERRSPAGSGAETNPEPLTNAELLTGAEPLTSAEPWTNAEAGTHAGAGGGAATARGGTPAEPVLDWLANELPGPSVRGVRHDREPDLSLSVGETPTAVLWDGFAEAGCRRPLAEALVRFGWTVRRVSAAQIVQAPAAAGALVRRSD